MQTHSEENYLKTIFKLSKLGNHKISVKAIADSLGNNPASVIDMLKKLTDKKLINYEKTGGAQLTKEGSNFALQIVRKHRLWEVFLKEKLEYSWAEVHEIAEQLEHIKHNELADRLDKILGFPEYDPHGDPIPGKDGSVTAYSRTPLTEVDAGQTTRVARVSDDDPALLRYLGELGMVPGAEVTVTSRAPFSGPMHIRVGGADETSHALGREVTDQVFVDEKTAA